MQHQPTVTALHDHELRAGLQERVATERTQLAEFLAYLGEIDARKLYAAWGHSSLFVFCTQELRLAENAAYRRIRTARAARTFPKIFSLIASGQTHCTAVTMIAPYLTVDNSDTLLSKICGQSKRAVEALIAALAPQPDVRDLVRRLPAQPVSTTRTGASCGNCADTLFANVAKCDAETRCDVEAAKTSHTACAANEPHVGSEHPENQPTMSIAPSQFSLGIIAQKSVSITPAHHEQMHPLSIDRIKFQFTASAAFREKFARAQTLLWHKFPVGKLEDIFSTALDALLAKCDPTLRGQRRGQRALAHTNAKHPSDTPNDPFAPSRNRHIPAHIKREVWVRDHQQCQFLSSDGTRCCEQRGLEVDHIQPFAIGGRSDDSDNLRLLCRTHNQWRWQTAMTSTRTGASGMSNAIQKKSSDTSSRVP